MSKKGKRTGKKVGIALTSILVLSGCFAGGAILGNNLNKDSAFADENNSLNQSYVELNKKYKDLLTQNEEQKSTIAELESSLAELSLLQGQLKEKEDEIASLEEQISTSIGENAELQQQIEETEQEKASLEDQITSLQNRIAQLEEQIGEQVHGDSEQTELRKKFMYSVANNLGEACVFGNIQLRNYFDIEDPGKDPCAIVYDMTSDRFIKVADEIFSCAEELGGNIFCMFDTSIFQINEENLIITQVYDNMYPMRFNNVMFGTDANGEECLLLLCGFGQQRVYEISKEGKVSQNVYEYDDFDCLSKRFLSKINREESTTTTIVIYENGEFVEKATLDFEVRYGSSGLYGNQFGYLEGVYVLESAYGDKSAYFNTEGEYVVVEGWSFMSLFTSRENPRLEYRIYSDEKIQLLDLNNMTFEDTGYTFKTDFRNIGIYDNAYTKFIIAEKEGETKLLLLDETGIQELLTFEAGKELDMGSMSGWSINERHLSLTYKYVGEEESNTFTYGQTV